ncbi:hypothetical protein LNO81_07970 [Klebsiella variicola subsp. variicola]|nr:hypothetical protein [Klebsiella variicola subsp. variicola]
MVTQTTALAPDGQPWRQVTLRNKAGMTVTVADWGATLLSAEVPLADGSLRHPLLGCARLEGLCPPGRVSWRLGRPLRQPYRQ